MKQSWPIILSLIVGFLFGFGLNSFYSSFENLSLDKMHQRVILERDLGIQKAMAEGAYNCCVEPVCTMCYMEANQWNNQKTGNCNCVNFIAEGKEPCPQCQRALNQGQSENCFLNEECNENIN